MKYFSWNKIGGNTMIGMIILTIKIILGIFTIFFILSIAILTTIHGTLLDFFDNILNKLKEI
jgi:hypothetical protein